MKDLPELPENYENPEPKKFDLKVHHRTTQDGLIAKNPYRLHILRGRKLFERPVGSGNLFYENNEVAGRMIYEKLENGAVKKTHEPQAEHKFFEPGPNVEELEVERLRKQNEHMQKELAAIREEQAKRAERNAVPAESKAQSSEETPKALKPETPASNVEEEAAEAPKEGSIKEESKQEETGEAGEKQPTKNYKDML